MTSSKPKKSPHKYVHFIVTILFFQIAARSASTRCGETVLFPELKLKITKLEKSLNLTDSHMKTLRTELKTQKAMISNLTTQVKEILHEVMQIFKIMQKLSLSVSDGK